VRPLLGLATLLLAAGCASALREPPPAAALAGSASVAAEPAALVEAAAAAFARRPDPRAVEQARDLSLRALATEDAPLVAFLGASRAIAWLIEHEAGADRRETLSVEGVQVGQLCRQYFPTEPECRYRLALAVGQQARERPSTATDGLDVMVELLEGLAAEAPDLDGAGPDRVLALVLLRAPGWPSGPGDPELGLEHARAAASRRPDHPSNQLVLGEALAANNRPAEGRRALERALELALQLAGQGDPDAAEWAAEARHRLGRQ
jgi:hypothetical protein